MPHAVQHISEPQTFVGSAGRPSEINNSDVPLNISKENKEPAKLNMAAGGIPEQEPQNSGNIHAGNGDGGEAAAASSSMAVATGTLNSETTPPSAFRVSHSSHTFYTSRASYGKCNNRFSKLTIYAPCFEQKTTTCPKASRPCLW